MFEKAKAKGVFTPAILVFFVAATAYLLSLTDVFLGLELRIYDMIFQRRGPAPVEETRMAIVAIDQPTFDSLAFPIDRTYYATLIEKLLSLGAKQIVFDILFTGPSNNPASDSIFRQAIADARNVVLCGELSLIYHPGISKPITSLIPPHPNVLPPGGKWGLINDLFDHDGVVRRYPLFMTGGDTAVVSLGMTVFALERGSVVPDSQFNVPGDFHFDGLSIPRIQDLSSTLLNFSGPAGTFPTYSFIDVVNGSYDLAAVWAAMSEEEKEVMRSTGMDSLFKVNPFEGKIVLVGASAEDLQDNKITPFFSALNRRRTPGVEVHANALQMFEAGTYIRPVPFYIILIGLILGSLATFMIGKHSTHWSGIVFWAGLMLVIMLGGYYLLVHQGYWLRQVPLLAAVGLGFPTNLLYRFIHSQREKAMIRGMFTQYLPKSYVQLLIQNPEMLKLGGERRRMSMLFSDVKGFSTISEKLTPEELVTLLNEYLTAMSRVVFQFDGMVDKYEGDLVMAEFGAPLWTPDHAAQACRTALGMQSKLAELRLKWKAEGRDELYCRVGVNTGDVIVGNMGSEEKFDYTVMGDAVNLASRLEGANKEYGTSIMIGYNTWLDVKDTFVTRPLDLLRVVGKLEPVAVYELMAEKAEEMTSEKLQVVAIYCEAIELYRKREFKQAKSLLEQALAIDPKDSPSKVYMGRCDLYIAEPPADDWDGVWTLHSK